MNPSPVTPSPSPTGADSFRHYDDGFHQDAVDEMFRPDGSVRPPYRGIATAISEIEPANLSARLEALDRAFIDQGITFSHSGQERPFPLDPLPRVIGAGEWTRLEAGIAQRVGALELFLDDVYGEQAILTDGVIPHRLINSCEHFHRQAKGIRPPNGVRIHVAGIDLIRDAHGDLRVLEDNVRSPSGVSYVMENRRTMARVFPDLFAAHRVRAVREYPGHLLSALQRSAPSNVASPTVVVLTPGVANSAYFEHSLLARQMGVELVEGRDLFCRDNVVYMRTTDGETRVDVIYRRIDDEYLDPLQFRPDSVLGVAGLVNAARAGNVVISSAIGNGVADDKLVYTYVPEIIRYYLGEEPKIDNVETLRCWLPDECAEVIRRIDELVIKPVEGSGGYGIVFGPDSTRAELDELAAKIRANPRGWIAQPVIALSTNPTLIDSALKPRHVDLRPFAVNDGESIWVLPGGLTRVALTEGSLVVNSSQGGGSKDTWVLATRGSGEEPEAPGIDLLDADIPPVTVLPMEPPAGPGTDQQQQQQQQQQQARRRPDTGKRPVGTCAIREGTDR